jgi:hypothetical protein
MASLSLLGFYFLMASLSLNCFWFLSGGREWGIRSGKRVPMGEESVCNVRILGGGKPVMYSLNFFLTFLKS